ncbi:MAG TPA: diacylglycerol kinase family protein [Acidimicrobiia bacterium]|nr:diacylglycerol kinase family protein [Acidimicrobiia bacterium]
MSRWLVLVNPQAGRKAVDGLVIRDVLAAAGVEGVVEQPTSVAEMRRTAVEASTDLDLVVVGGDGTVSLVVDALMHAAPERMPTIGILPNGTGCDLLKTFGIPGTMEGAARHLRGTTTYQIDVGRLDGEWGRRHFVNVAQAGAGAAAAETAPRLPRRWGSARYPIAFAARLPGFPAAELEVQGNRGYRGPALAVVLANAQFFAGGWNIAPKAMLMDGELDVQVINARKRQAVGIVPRIIKGTHLSLPQVQRMSLASLSVRTSVPWPVEVDGDHIGSTPFDARVIPGAVTLKI